MQHLGIPFLLKMQHEVLFFSPHFIDDTLNTRAECVRDSLICRKYMFLAKIFALRSMGIQLVPSPPLSLSVSLCVSMLPEGNLAYIDSNQLRTGITGFFFSFFHYCLINKPLAFLRSPYFFSIDNAAELFVCSNVYL